ncbi:hypothetical protein QUF58_03615 [Anaerolineales bacterium HSG24]|nr:hypothetical protein [Anaerolineales bacterium HSG24]
MKKEYRFAMNDQIKLWRNADNPDQHFVDLNFRFMRPLTDEERNEAVCHLVARLQELQTQTSYVIYNIDFSKTDFLQLTLRHIALDNSRLLTQLVAGLKERFPVSSPKKERLGIGHTY